MMLTCPEIAVISLRSPYNSFSIFRIGYLLLSGSQITIKFTISVLGTILNNHSIDSH